MTDKNAPIRFSSILRRQDGQLTIFLAIGLTIFMTMMAFIINVGLFVKAKINLQNATDAAAWSGAAVQARQLSQIGYLNYEMHNVYKEWMFKYYVLGNLGHSLRMDSTGTHGDFRLRPAGGLNAAQNFDRYNLPSICVHAGTGTNDICLSSFIPGLPRFETIDLPNITDESQKFIDAISSKKADDCAYRSSINFATALLWTYGTGANLITADLPALANGRLGAWPAAFLLGVRIRSMEAIVNRPPEAQPICIAGSGCTPVETLDRRHIANERPIKAFYALLRNYSGGGYKDGSEGMDESRATIRLEELAPNEQTVGEATLSGMLIPPNSSVPWNNNPFTKRYLDLQAVPINYAIFYTTMSARSEALTIDGTTLPSDASCSTTKTAIPVPAYLMGFQKNPKFLTYYAVRSSVKFTGLFFPGSWRDANDSEGGGGITISAVSAAKPFGGRIGPRLFNLTDTEVFPRDQSISPKSAPFISGLLANSAGSDLLRPGTPIPTGSNFWVNSATSIVGGVPGASATPKYVIPNMLYSFSSPSAGNSEVTVHSSAGGAAFADLSEYSANGMSKREVIGLYDPQQFRSLMDNLKEVDPGSGVFDGAALTEAVTRVRQPTFFDSNNYLIPSITDVESTNIKSNKNGDITLFQNPLLRNQMVLYGPLIDDAGENSLYRNPADLQSLVVNYIEANEASIVSFLTGLRDVANEIKISSSSDLYDKAAEIIYPLSSGVAPNNKAAFASQMNSAFCGAGATNQVSVAARFSAFLQQLDGACDEARPLAYNIRKYVVDTLTNDPSFGVYHKDEWWRGPAFGRTGNSSEADAVSSVMSAYRPGPANGADNDGTINNPLTGGSYGNRRNYYSTKFIPLDMVVLNPSSSSPSSSGIFPTLHERFDGSAGEQGILGDVRTLMGSGIDNKLREDITVRW